MGKVYEYAGEYGTFAVESGRGGIFRILHDGLDRETIHNEELMGDKLSFEIYRHIIFELFKENLGLFPPIVDKFNSGYWHTSWNGGPYVDDFEPSIIMAEGVPHRKIEIYEEKINGYYVENRNCALVINKEGSFIKPGRLQFYKPKFYKYHGEFGFILLRFDRKDKLYICEVALDIEKIYLYARQSGKTPHEYYKHILFEMFGEEDLYDFFPTEPFKRSEAEECYGILTDYGYKLVNSDAYSIELDNTGMTIEWQGEFVEKKEMTPWKNQKFYTHESAEALLAVKIEDDRFHILSNYVNLAMMNEYANDICKFYNSNLIYRAPAYTEILYSLFRDDIREFFTMLGPHEHENEAYLVNENFALIFKDFKLYIKYDKKIVESIIESEYLVEEI